MKKLIVVFMVIGSSKAGEVQNRPPYQGVPAQGSDANKNAYRYIENRNDPLNNPYLDPNNPSMHNNYPPSINRGSMQNGSELAASQRQRFVPQQPYGHQRQTGYRTNTQMSPYPYYPVKPAEEPEQEAPTIMTVTTISPKTPK